VLTVACAFRARLIIARAGARIGGTFATSTSTSAPTTTATAAALVTFSALAAFSAIRALVATRLYRLRRCCFRLRSCRLLLWLLRLLLLLLLSWSACGVRMLAMLALVTLAVALTAAMSIRPTVTTSFARCGSLLVVAAAAIAVMTAVTAAVAVTIAVPALTTFVPVAPTFMGRPAGLALRGRGRLLGRRRTGTPEQEAPGAHEDADLLDRRGRLDRSNRRLLCRRVHVLVRH
jgi:hypothetical protein